MTTTGPRSSRHRHARILFFATNRLYLEHFLPVLRTLVDDPTVLVRTTGPRKLSLGAGSNAVGRWAPLPVAILQPWDVVVYSSSRGTSLFPFGSKRALLPHGIGGGKIVDGASWRYGRVRTMRRGQRIFDLILEASPAEAQRVEREFPWLEGSVVGVGTPMLDPLHRAAKHRSSTHVLIQSTYGPASLVESVGPAALVDQARLVAGTTGRPVILSLHPNHWTGYAGTKVLGPMVASLVSDPVRLLPPHTPLENYLPNVIAAISDHTNLSAVVALLEIPQLVMRPAPDIVDKGSPVAEVHRHCVELALHQPWGEQMEKLLHRPNFRGSTQLRDRLAVNIGSATEATASAVKNLAVKKR